MTEAPPVTETLAVAGRSIFELFAEAKRKVGPVGKDSTNTQQHFNYRGVDAVVNAIATAFDELGIIPVPMLQRYEYREGVEIGKARSLMGHVQVEVGYRFYGPCGDYFDAKVPGEAMDSGDKATAKAMSVAYRICLLQTLNLPTSDPDPDSTSYERSDARSGDSRGAAFDNASPVRPGNNRQAPEQPAQPQQPQQRREIPPQAPLADDDNWSGFIADMKTLEDCAEGERALKDAYDRKDITPERTNQVLYWIRQKADEIRGGTGGEAAAPAGDGPGQEWIAAWRAELARAVEDDLLPLRRQIGQAVGERIITPEQGSTLNGEISDRRQGLEKAQEQDQAAEVPAA
jgi:hypothetical protein